MIQLDQIHVDIQIDTSISREARLLLMDQAEKEIKTGVFCSECCLKSRMQESDRRKFKITVTKI